MTAESQSFMPGYPYAILSHSHHTTHPSLWALTNQKRKNWIGLEQRCQTSHPKARLGLQTLMCCYFMLYGFATKCLHTREFPQKIQISRESLSTERSSETQLTFLHGNVCWSRGPTVPFFHSARACVLPIPPSDVATGLLHSLAWPAWILKAAGPVTLAWSPPSCPDS